MRLTSILIYGLASLSAVSADPRFDVAQPSLSTRLWSLGKSYFTGETPEHVLLERQRIDEKDGMVRLTDENYAELVQRGDEDTLWVIMIHQDRVPIHAQAFHDAHTNANSLYKDISAKSLGGSTEETGKKVIFARMEYNTEWRTCTRWLVFKPPRLVLVSDQGRSLRFLDLHQIKPDAQAWAEWIKEGHWAEVPPWTSSLHPTGDKAWTIEWYIKAFDGVSVKTTKIPPLVWLMFSGTAAKFLMDFLWSGSKPVTNAPGTRTRPLNRTPRQGQPNTSEAKT